MFVGLFVIVHCILYSWFTLMRIIMHQYLAKKPPGLQSVLDLLIMDLLKTTIFNYSVFLIFLFSGYCHGHLPYAVSQVMIFHSVNSNVYLFGLFQFFLMAKAVMIFRRSWIDEVSDSWVTGFSRSFGLLYTFIRFMGDYLTRKGGPASVMTKFLTSTDVQS